jgi:hypothetical protein
MKKSINYILIALLAVGTVACDYDELMEWEGGTDIYFTNMANSHISARSNDVIEVKFYYLHPNTTEVLVPLLITTTGPFKNFARDVSIRVLSANLEPGKHYDIVKSSIGEGVVTDTIWIRLKRSDLEARDRVEQMIVELIRNDNFTTNYVYTQDGVNERPRLLLQYPILVSDIVVEPEYWRNEFFNRFSKEKFALVVEINDIPRGFLNGEEYNGVVLTSSATSLFPWLLPLGHRVQEYLDHWHNPAYSGDPLSPPPFPNPEPGSGGVWSTVWPRDTIWEPALNQYGVREIMSMGSRVTGN